METATAQTEIPAAIPETVTAQMEIPVTILETAMDLATETIIQTVMVTVIPVAIAMETTEIPVTVFLATKAKAAENKRIAKKLLYSR